MQCKHQMVDIFFQAISDPASGLRQQRADKVGPFAAARGPEVSGRDAIRTSEQTPLGTAGQKGHKYQTCRARKLLML
jgi:hypothetical protein